MNQLAISSIIGNQSLASEIHKSITTALRNPLVHLMGGESVRDIFKYSLHAAIRDIENHPRNKLLLRLIESDAYDDSIVLSNAECGLCVEFIYSHLINRFKGELSELLALEHCINLIGQLRQNGQLSSDIQLFWGETIQERRKFKLTTEQGSFVRWGAYTKGADGLLVEQAQGGSQNQLKIQGIIEVKSVTYTKKKVLEQIDQHLERLEGGFKLNEKEWAKEKLILSPTDNNIIRIVILASLRRKEVEPLSLEKVAMPLQVIIDEFEPNCWRISLPWTQETLNLAAYQMTFWYMTVLHKGINIEEALVMPEQTSCHTIKMILHNILLRPLSHRQKRFTSILYDTYCSCYPLATDSDDENYSEDDSSDQVQ